MLHGIQGLLDEQYIDLSTQIHSELDIELLKRTPSAFLGSCRFKLPEIHEDKTIYEKIFGILNRLDIDAFIYIGGNDSMDTIKKLSDFAILTGQKQKFLGVPKTIDNDLALTDHTPGFGSAAKYIGASTKEVIRDAQGLTYKKSMITIMEEMQDGSPAQQHLQEQRTATDRTLSTFRKLHLTLRNSLSKSKISSRRNLPL